MTTLPPSPLKARLERLKILLQEDPRNSLLLAEVFDTALASGELDYAAETWATARQQHQGDAQWQVRRAHLALARRELGDAAAVLQDLGRTVGNEPAVAHDLAYVLLLQGDLPGCRSSLQPFLDSPIGDSQQTLGPQVESAMQVLWLRATHRLQLPDEAMQWARDRSDAGRLHPAAKGVASLAAVDAGDLTLAKRWSEEALQADAHPPEALIAAACVALAEARTGDATVLAGEALKANPDDGRIWSTLGFASLQARDLPRAQSQLENAVRHMAGHIGTWHALGWARLLQGARDQALDAFRRALALDRNFAESHGAVGLVLGLAGDPEARRHLDIADRLDPRNLTARYARELIAGGARDREALRRLALRLLDRPGFFGGKLSDAFTGMGSAPKQDA